MALTRSLIIAVVAVTGVLACDKDGRPGPQELSDASPVSASSLALEKSEKKGCVSTGKFCVEAVGVRESVDGLTEALVRVKNTDVVARNLEADALSWRLLAADGAPAILDARSVLRAKPLPIRAGETATVGLLFAKPFAPEARLDVGVSILPLTPATKAHVASFPD
jgi:hypothetical protein